jgi:hypothetical protein
LDGLPQLVVVDALVLVKTRVLRNAHGLLENGGDAVKTDPDLPDLQLLAGGAAFAETLVDQGRGFRVLRFEITDIREAEIDKTPPARVPMPPGR